MGKFCLKADEGIPIFDSPTAGSSTVGPTTNCIPTDLGIPE